MMTAETLDTRFTPATAALETEQALLGCLLNDPGRCAGIKRIIKGDDFFEGPDGIHARMYAALLEAGDEDVCFAALTARFAETLQALGQPRLIFTLADKAPPATVAPTLAEQVAAAGAQRRVQRNLARPGLTLPELNETLQAEARRVADASVRGVISATPYVWRPASAIPPRQWLYGRHYIRKFVSGTLAPGGFGKSSHELVEAVAMATGRDLLGVKLREPLRVWYWNGEDPLDEIERKVAAICLHYGITEDDLGGRLFINSGRDHPIIIAQETRDGLVMGDAVLEQLKATIIANRIDVVALDPFVSCHAVSENDNNKIGAVMKALAGIADVTDCAIDLVHHVKKGRESASGEVGVNDGRGASAFLDRVRSARVLNRMTKEEAQQLGINASRGEHLDFFRIEHGKANLSARSLKAAWRRMVSVELGNGGGGPDDKIGVATLWKPDAGLEAASVNREVRMTPGQKLIMRALAVTIDAGHGVPVPPVPGVPPGTEGLRRADLRQEAQRLGYADPEDKPESVKRMINRDITALVAAEILRVHDDYVWAPK